ncbi:MAG: peptidase M48 [Candidatus Marinimicrobia bacterium]|nr:peptidase M48 [Candidatus Neomarinimicrobiota bacterium]
MAPIHKAFAQDFGRGAILSDTEIGNTLRAYARPILNAGGIPPDNISIHMVVDDSLNAFVTAGNRMFFHTGLLLKTKNSNEVIGVMAHEIGHIAGGHAVTTTDGMAKASGISMLAMLLGVAAGVASGNPDAGLAVFMGGQQVALGKMLSFSRSVENSSDQFAIQALEETGQSAKGLYDFFSTLAGQEMLISTSQDPYMRTHPLTRDRMATIRAAIERSPYSEVAPNPRFELEHRRMIAKLFAFLKPQITTLQRYPKSDTSIEARYARAIAYYRRGQFDQSIPLIDGLLIDEPEDPYFWQIKGDMLLSKSDIDEAVVAYSQALEYLPDAPEILIAMAHAMTQRPTANYSEKAQKALRRALTIEPENPAAWDMLARSYAYDDNLGMSAYASAERAILLGQFAEVQRYTEEAEKYIDKKTPTWYRLQDIKIVAKNYKEDMKRR